MSDSTDIIIPDLGDFSDVEVIEVLVAEGDTVAKEDGLITLETDKATMDIPAPADGVIDSLTVKVGDRVSSGDAIGRLGGADGPAAEGRAGDAEAGDRGSGGDRADDAAAQRAADESGAGGADDDADGGSAAGKTAGGGEQTVEVPDIGDFEDVDVIEVLVSEGDEVRVEDPLLTLETDKATMDVPSPVGGTVRSVLIRVGSKVSKGTPVAVIEASRAESAGSAESAPQAAPEETPSRPAHGESGSAEAGQEPQQAPPEEPAGALPPIDEAGFSQAHASPSVRKLARELGVDLVQVRGSGPKNRILHDDVKAFVKRMLDAQAPGAAAALPQVPSVDFAGFGEIDVQPLTRIQKISGPRLQASWINLPHVTQHDLADISAMEARRQKLKGAAKERGISLTPLAFIMKACVSVLQEFPRVNASLSSDGESLVYKKYYHLGFAADTEQGLMVPVIRNADTMDVYELASQLGELSRAARDGKLKSDQMQGASFTISSLGGIGGTAFTPIINAPEVAILGVSRAATQPVWNGDKFEPRLMLPLSFSYDHRVIDGAYAVRFTTYLSEVLADADALLEAIP